jgi:Transglutaminase-like superfamily
MPQTTAVPRFRARSWAERALLVESAVWLTVTRTALAAAPWPRIGRLLRLSGAEDWRRVRPDQAVEAARVAWAVRAAAAHGPGVSSCLAQALTVTALLSRRGIPSTFCLGVARDGASSAGIAAHAWSRCGDAILTGEYGHDRFSVVATLAARPRRERPVAWSAMFRRTGAACIHR